MIFFIFLSCFLLYSSTLDPFLFTFPQLHFFPQLSRFMGDLLLVIYSAACGTHWLPTTHKHLNTVHNAYEYCNCLPGRAPSFLKQLRVITLPGIRFHYDAQNSDLKLPQRSTEVSVSSAHLSGYLWHELLGLSLSRFQVHLKPIDLTLVCVSQCNCLKCKFLLRRSYTNSRRQLQLPFFLRSALTPAHSTFTCTLLLSQPSTSGPSLIHPSIIVNNFTLSLHTTTTMETKSTSHQSNSGAYG